MPELRVVECKGEPRQIGRIYGECCSTLIKELVEQFLQTACQRFGGSAETYLEAALAYQKHLQEFPHLTEEIRGVAEGAGITLAEAMLLQCRGEILFGGLPECTAFAARPPATADGLVFSGQNFDLEPVDKYMVLVKVVPNRGPALMYITVAGAIGYGGINSAGLAVNLNLVRSAGWRIGVPAYLVTSLALEQKDVNAAVKVVTNVFRASSRNYLLTDCTATICDLETTVNEWALTGPKAEGYLVHANHFVADQFKTVDTGVGEWPDSIVRQARLEELIASARGNFSPDEAMEFLRDHFNYPQSICRHDVQAVKPSKTAAGIVCLPQEGAVYAVSGNPCQSKWQRYELG